MEIFQKFIKCAGWNEACRMEKCIKNLHFLLLNALKWGKFLTDSDKYDFDNFENCPNWTT